MLHPCGLAPNQTETWLHFHYAFGFSTLILAYTLDSLVRVSRRADKDHFVKQIESPVTVLDTLRHRGSCKQSHTYLHRALIPRQQFQLTKVAACYPHRLPKSYKPRLTSNPSTARRTNRHPNNNLYRLLLAISSTFDSLFKVLFTFPSRYLCSIGLPHVFSFGRNLPPD